MEASYASIKRFISCSNYPALDVKTTVYGRCYDIKALKLPRYIVVLLSTYLFDVSHF